jgi:hypothetical protein
MILSEYILNRRTDRLDEWSMDALSQDVSKMEAEITRLRAELEGVQSLITECTDNGELDSRLFESYIGHVTGKVHSAPVVPEGYALVPIDVLKDLYNSAHFTRVSVRARTMSAAQSLLSAAKEPQC